ncbi:unnamed protein product [Chondrus crispus]|uniref:Uncharacterized protein n=1 Tax=Chondrus crispus TaxID=2769 RepID=R7Q8D4_CHOCR|nr:unnamed protein product [Chondrus crispus]CDF34802.1 unnamed protein product [Chondrus crispus]|eukprot:XP_005714621.1 unnamed protein product [Chondrus crispus]
MSPGCLRYVRYGILSIQNPRVSMFEFRLRVTSRLSQYSHKSKQSAKIGLLTTVPSPKPSFAHVKRSHQLPP